MRNNNKEEIQDISSSKRQLSSSGESFINTKDQEPLINYQTQRTQQQLSTEAALIENQANLMQPIKAKKWSFLGIIRPKSKFIQKLQNRAKGQMEESYNWKIFYEIIYNYIQVILHISLIFSYILLMDININKPDVNQQIFKEIELFLGIILAVFYICFALTARNIKDYIFETQNIINIITIITILISFFLQENEGFWILLKALQTVRILSLNHIIKLNLDITTANISSDEIMNAIDTTSRISSLNMAVLYFALDIIYITFIGSGCVMVSQQFLKKYDKVGFIEPSGNGLGFIQSVYFLFVTISTVGYGDIYPYHVFTRFLMIFFAMALVFLISSRSSAIGAALRQQSQFNLNYNLSNHIILCGSFSSSILQKILNELYNENENQSQLKILIVAENEPSSHIKSLMESYQYIDKVFYLKADIFNNQWWQKSNLIKCKSFQMISLSQNKPQLDQFEIALAYLCQDITHSFQGRKIPFRINFVTTNNLVNLLGKNMFSWLKVDTYISMQQFSGNILSIATKNPGFNTFLTHVLTKNEYFVNQLPKNITEYAKGINQSIFIVNFSSFFKNKYKFSEASKMIYFHQKEQLAKSYGNSEISAVNILLIGVARYVNPEDELFQLSPTKNFEQEPNRKISKKIHPDNSKKNGKMEIFINPKNFLLKKDDKAFVIARNQQEADKVKYYCQNDYENYNKFIKKFSDINKQQVTQIIEKSFSSSENEKENYVFSSKNYNQGKITQFPEVVDLDYENITFQEVLFGHIVVYSAESVYQDIIQSLRQHYSKPILFFTQNQINEQEWHKIRTKNNNVLLAKGIAANFKHISKLNLNNAHKILIFADSNNIEGSNQNVDYLMFWRSCKAFGCEDKTIVEIDDESWLSLLDNKPDEIGMKDMQQLWPNFMGGKVFFRSLASAILAQSIQQVEIINLLKKIIGIKSQNSHQTVSNIIDEDLIVNSLKITPQIVQKFEDYGKLQWGLMNYGEGLICIGIFKRGTKHTSKTEKIKLQSWLGDVFLTNPSLDTPLKEGDQVLLIGSNGSLIIL